MVYESNPKHRDPWQPGRKGSLCPVSITTANAQALLDRSEAIGEYRYAIWEGRVFEAQEHQPGRWHGYPVGWVEVPEKLRRRWQADGLVTRRQIGEYSTVTGNTITDEKAVGNWRAFMITFPLMEAVREVVVAHAAYPTEASPFDKLMIEEEREHRATAKVRPARFGA